MRPLASNAPQQRPSIEIAATAGRIDAFVREDVIRFERDARCTPHGPGDTLVGALRTLAAQRGLLTPHIVDGSHRSHAETAVLFRAAGYSPLGPIALNIMAPDEGNMLLLHKVASRAQRTRYLDPLVAGDVRSCFLMTEPAQDGGAGSDPSMMRTTARRDGKEWVIDGRKAFSTGAVGAGFAIVMAMAPEGATLFLADMATPGIVIERVIDTIDSSMPGGHAVVRLDEVRVAGDAVLGEVGKGFAYAQLRLAPARLTHCMRWTGAARRAHDIATDYACRRHAFGKPLIDHEGVGFMLADNLIDLKQAELMTDWCAGLLDEGLPAIRESSMAKVAVSEGLFRVADRCVQVMGGTGVSGDTVVEQIFRELRAFRIYDGPSEVHRWSLAKQIKRDHAQRGE